MRGPADELHNHVIVLTESSIPRHSSDSGTATGSPRRNAELHQAGDAIDQAQPVKRAAAITIASIAATLVREARVRRTDGDTAVERPPERRALHSSTRVERACAQAHAQEHVGQRTVERRLPKANRIDDPPRGWEVVRAARKRHDTEARRADGMRELDDRDVVRIHVDAQHGLSAVVRMHVHMARGQWRGREQPPVIHEDGHARGHAAVDRMEEAMRGGQYKPPCNDGTAADKPIRT